mmetsp:Transcript_25883/g.53355  ORF Transcript_25883/g.53355 Transcript_25883/m.53355 type:complete len:220 (-) Transcript_25883:251-910(-)
MTTAVIMHSARETTKTTTTTTATTHAQIYHPHVELSQQKITTSNNLQLVIKPKIMSVNEVKIKKAEVAFEIRGTGPPTSRTFVLGDEDHTLGNALRHVLINDPRVDFTGYCVPHPSEPVVQLRVQTKESLGGGGSNSKGDGEGGEGNVPVTAIEALKEACMTLSEQCDIVLQKLEVEMPEVREDRERIARLEEADMMEGGIMEEEEAGMDEENFMDDEE